MNTTTLWLWLLPDAHGHQVFGIGDSTANARADAEENLLAEREDAEEAGETIAPGAYQVAAGYPCRVEFGVASSADEGAALCGLAGDWSGVLALALGEAVDDDDDDDGDDGERQPLRAVK